LGGGNPLLGAMGIAGVPFAWMAAWAADNQKGWWQALITVVLAVVGVLGWLLAIFLFWLTTWKGPG
jgi:hypothetical protein